jgi:isocitrate/isopropylmalate dehydrogenase
MKKILVLPGDGIGVEVADQTIRVIDHLNKKIISTLNTKRN